MTASKSKGYKVIMVSLTCSYYQVELFRDLSSNPRIDLMVYFCSEEAIPGKDLSRMFNTNARWGREDELLGGYKYKFLKNYSPWASYLKAYCGLVNFGIWKEISREKPDIVILMGWNNPTWWIAAMACLVHKIPFCYMSDTNIQGESNRAKPTKLLKRLFLGVLQFPLASAFLCSGSSNRRFYEIFGVPSRKLIPFAYSWGYRKLLDVTDDYLQHKKELRQELKIGCSDRVILFCGRFVKEKNLHNLILAYGNACTEYSQLIMVGDGELGDELRALVEDQNISSIQFRGFQNRSEISKYYAVADYLVLASTRETWGLVINEAMCFGLPILTSNQVGSADDLVRNHINGFVFPDDNVNALSEILSQALHLPEEERVRMGLNSKDMISDWSDRDMAEPLLEFMDGFLKGR